MQCMQNDCYEHIDYHSQRPRETHDELVERAHRAGQSLQEYVLHELTEIANKPDINALMTEREHVCSRTRTT